MGLRGERDGEQPPHCWHRSGFASQSSRAGGGGGGAGGGGGGWGGTGGVSTPPGLRRARAIAGRSGVVPGRWEPRGAGRLFALAAATPQLWRSSPVGLNARSWHSATASAQLDRAIRSASVGFGAGSTAAATLGGAASAGAFAGVATEASAGAACVAGSGFA